MIFRSFVKSLSEEKGLLREYGLYSAVEQLAPEIISEERKMYKGGQRKHRLLQWIRLQHA